MNAPHDLKSAQHRIALDEWLENQERRISQRFPLINFYSNHWPIRTLYKTDQPDWYFDESVSEFASKDVSYVDALRCLVAEIVIVGKPKAIDYAVTPYRWLVQVSSNQLFDLTLQNLRQLEVDRLNIARENPAAAVRCITGLSYLSNKLLPELSAHRVISRHGFYIRAEVKSELKTIDNVHRLQITAGENETLDRKMEAFNDAFNALIKNPLDLSGKPILSAIDREAISVTGILTCVPSRINEPLCMSIDDHITIDDYFKRPNAEQDTLHSAHQLLQMKGSKGAEWSAKPVLLFLMDVLNECIKIVLEQGQRSRMLINWYRQHPTTLFLPKELEHLRGQTISRQQLSQIVYLSENPPPEAEKAAPKKYFRELISRVFKGANPKTLTKAGNRNSRNEIEYVLWADAESLLLEKVHEAMAKCRRVTDFNHYQGDLSKMLFLFDREEVPFQPHAINGTAIRRCLKRNESDRKRTLPPTLFTRLNITMPVAGKIQVAEIDTHDPRRWLTTMGLLHGERLSDVIINKWANRSSLAQLKNYDFRTAETKATLAAMPGAIKLSELNELTDMSNGLAKIEQLEEQFGLNSAAIIAHESGIAMTSMDAVTEAIENRPIAKSSRGIIIIYPQRFGVCFHQHHEKPCRNYSNDLETSCVTCDGGAFVKGHIPTNDEIRRIAPQLYGSLLRHLENLTHTHNRSVADDPAGLGEHMLTLVEKGLDRNALEHLANHLITDFHQINHLLKDRQLARRLEQAFVSRGVLGFLDDPNVANGALIKYHNPTQHAEPLLEIALHAHGGREQVARDEVALIEKHPQLAPKALGLSDERHLITPDTDAKDD